MIVDTQVHRATKEYTDALNNAALRCLQTEQLDKAFELLQKVRTERMGSLRCGCGSGEPSPGADVAGGEPSLGANVAG